MQCSVGVSPNSRLIVHLVSLAGIWETVIDSANFQQLFDSQLCFGQNLPESAGTNAFVVRNDNARVRVIAPEDNMTPSLEVHNKSPPAEVPSRARPETSVNFNGGCWW